MFSLEEITEITGTNIMKFRTIRKQTQEEFAADIGVSRPALASYEEQRAMPKINTLLKLSDMTSLDIKTLVTTKNLFRKGGEENG